MQRTEPKKRLSCAFGERLPVIGHRIPATGLIRVSLKTQIRTQSRITRMAVSSVRPAHTLVTKSTESPESAAFAPASAPQKSPVVGFSGNRRVPNPQNEPVKTYAPGSPERASLKERLQSMANERIEIPLIIGGKEVRTGDLAQTVMPHNHRHVLGDWHRARVAEI